MMRHVPAEHTFSYFMKKKELPVDAVIAPKRAFFIVITVMTVIQ